MILGNNNLSQRDLLILSSIGLVAYAENMIEAGVESITPQEIRARGMTEYHHAMSLEEDDLN